MRVSPRSLGGEDLEGLSIDKVPTLREPLMVVAFAGWSDANEAATRSVRYLVQELKAERFAEIDPELYYDFTLVRPIVRADEQGERTVTWPANEFFYRRGDAPSRDFVLFVGIEPNLRWRAYTNGIVDVAEQCGATVVICLGAFLDAVPHTRDIRVTGSATAGSLRELLEAQGARNSGYQGPTGIATALMEACQRRGLPYASIWGRSPHYLQNTYNPKVSHALISKLGQLLGIEFNLERLWSAGVYFEREVQKALASNADLSAYISRLEQEYDAVSEPLIQQEVPSAEAIVHDLEEFLRQQRRSGQDEPT